MATNDTTVNMGNFDASPAMSFESIHDQPAKIKVIGVGGGGGNAVNHMYSEGITGVDFIVCNTDAKALNASPVPYKIALGTLGAGNKPERARKAALEHKDQIREAISSDTQMLFITAGMGGGTGTGAAPVIAEIAKSIELDDEEVPRILVVAIVTMPFSFEGRVRHEQALLGIEELRKNVDSILIINNDKLRSLGNLPLREAFSQADDVLLTAAKGIAEIITVSAYISTDFRDVNTVMENSGTALMGSGEGRGENRARQAIEAATTSVLLDDNDIRGAKNILLNFSFSSHNQITMDELGEVTDYLTELTGSRETNVIWGAVDDDRLNDELHITFIATGFEQKAGPQKYVLPQVEKKEEKVEVPVAPEQPVNTIQEPVITEPTVIQRPVTEQVAPQQPATPQQQQPLTPFDVKNNAQQSTERKIWLLDPEEVEVEDDVEVATMEAPKAPAHNYLEDIRIKPVEPAKDDPFASISKPAPVAPEPVVSAPVQHAPTPKTTFNESTQQPRMHMTEQFDDERMFSMREERIRKINEILRNHPDGPRMIEELTTEQLSGQPIFEVSSSATREATRPTMSADGTMTRGISYLEDLPD